MKEVPNGKILGHISYGLKDIFAQMDLYRSVKSSFFRHEHLWFTKKVGGICLLLLKGILQLLTMPGFTSMNPLLRALALMTRMASCLLPRRPRRGLELPTLEVFL